MKRQTLWLLFAGSLLMAFPVLISSLYTVPGLYADFLIGLGAGIIIAAFILEINGDAGIKFSNSNSK